MTRRAIVLVSALLVFGLGSGRAWAQETPEPDAVSAKAVAKVEKAAPRPVPTATLRVLVLISRFQGEKKMLALPYTFTVTAGGSRARLRTGVDTPVPIGDELGPGQVGLGRSFTYKSIGTNIDCLASDLGQGRYILNLEIENSSMASSGDQGEVSASKPLAFRKFNASFDLLLRDGQTLQTVASTDPLGGEVVKIDVTLNVVK